MATLSFGQDEQIDLVARQVADGAAARALREGTDPYDALLERVRKLFKGTFTPAQMENPGPTDRRRMAELVREELERFNRVALADNRPTVSGPPDLIVERVLDELLGLGPLDPLLRDESIEDIYILGPHRVIVVRSGGQREMVTGVDFGSERRLMELVQRALAWSGRQVNFARPYADARLKDGSRIHVILHPVAEPWPQVVIRRHRSLFAPGEDRLDKLVRLGTLTQEAADFLRRVIAGRGSILITGATASGKTTLINALSGSIPPDDAVVVIEDTRELDVPLMNVSYLVTRVAGEAEGTEVTQRDLVVQALRKRPDWIILGEARGAEAWDFVQAGNTGHAVMGSIHANGPRDALERFRDLCLMAARNLPENVALRNVVRAFHVVVYAENDRRLRRRVVRSIVGVTGNVAESGVPTLQALFEWADGRLVNRKRQPYKRLQEILDAGGDRWT